jgi:hypothetical protein
MANGNNTESGTSCRPGHGDSPDSSVTRPPQMVVCVATAAAIGALVGALLGSALSRG